jgi:DNA polymerase-3 subunit delta
VQYASWLRAAEAGQVAPVTLLHGAEPFLIDEAIGRVTRALIPDAAELAMSRDVLEAREAGPEGIVRAAQTFPWGAARRVVVARGVEALGPKQAEPLVEYLGQPNPTTALLLPVPQPLASSHWLLKAVAAAAAPASGKPASGEPASSEPASISIVEVPRLSGRSLIGWLRAHAASEGLELAEDAAQLLVTFVGEEPAALAAELGKAALAGGADNRRVGGVEIRAVVGEHRSREIFELTRAVELRDAGSALPLLDRLLSAGEEPLRILAILAGQARRATPAAARLARCWKVERRLKLGGLARPELCLLVADLCAD